MSRAVDKLPNPSQVRPMKVIGLGASRTGTLGLYQALKMLGFYPFHISELLPHGIQQMKALQEAISAAQSKNGQPFGRIEFEKMWGEYDCLIECPCYLGAAGIEYFLQDSNVKFILTDRSPESFAKSLTGSLGTYNAKLNQFPLSVAKYFDSFLWELSAMFNLMTFRWSDGLLDPTNPSFKTALEKNYIEYVAEVKALVPPERLLILSLEKGFGWNEICDFLDCKVPDSPYPRINAMSEFHVAAEMVVAPARRRATGILVSSAVAVLGIGIFWWRR